MIEEDRSYLLLGDEVHDSKNKPSNSSHELYSDGSNTTLPVANHRSSNNVMSRLDLQSKHSEVGDHKDFETGQLQPQMCQASRNSHSANDPDQGLILSSVTLDTSQQHRMFLSQDNSSPTSGVPEYRPLISELDGSDAKRRQDNHNASFVSRILNDGSIRKNWKVFLGSFVLTLIGAGLIITGLALEIMVGFGPDIKAIVILLIGVVFFAPGAYHFVYMCCAANGVSGFHFNKLPVLRKTWQDEEELA